MPQVMFRSSREPDGLTLPTVRGAGTAMPVAEKRHTNYYAGFRLPSVAIQTGKRFDMQRR